MECKACGYTYNPELPSTYNENLEFLRVTGYFAIECKYERNYEVKLIACPHCFTTQVNRVW